uniref:Uncharacterized protein n=1 Tax=Vespula pensylvanica TaxID=30213 RepID=A0A834P329_VESPE|nr:hypothetical protein H0235_006637 [Vespula pensylvanica]
MAVMGDGGDDDSLGLDWKDLLPVEELQTKFKLLVDSRGTARHGTARYGTAGITPAMQQRERREVKDSEIRSGDCSYYYDAVLSVGRYARRFWKSQNSDLEIDLMAVMV